MRKIMKHLVAIIALLTLTTACTTTDEIIIDKKGVDIARYEKDLAECSGYASEVKTGEKAHEGYARSTSITMRAILD